MPFDPLDLLRRKDGSWRVDPADLYAPFLDLLLSVLRRCHGRGRDYYVTSGLRWYSEQATLYEKHRAGGPRAAAPGFSAHQYGIAVDAAPDGDLDKPGLQPDYSSAAYDVLVEEARAAGLVSGRDFNDNPHVQWPNFVSGEQLHALRRVWLAAEGDDRAKLRAVWRYLDAHPIGPVDA